MKKVTIISGSPKPHEPAASEFLAERAVKILGTPDIEARHFSAIKCGLKGETEKAFSEMCASDALVFIFPLYFFCVPGMLMRFLQDYAAFLKNGGANGKSPLVYAVVNCGFPEGGINDGATRVIENFARAIGGRFGFGVLIGGGGMLLGASNAPPVKKMLETVDKAFGDMKSGILNPTAAPSQNVTIDMKFPHKLYFFFGNQGWYSEAKKNKLSKKDLYAKPYEN